MLQEKTFSQIIEENPNLTPLEKFNETYKNGVRHTALVDCEVYEIKKGDTFLGYTYFYGETCIMLGNGFITIPSKKTWEEVFGVIEPKFPFRIKTSREITMITRQDFPELQKLHGTGLLTNEQQTIKGVQIEPWMITENN